MKVLLVVLSAISAANALALSLSILPDLAFLIEDGRGTLYDVNGTHFTELASVEPNSFFPGIPDNLVAASYLLRRDGSGVVTAFFRGRRVWVQPGDNVVKLGMKLPQIFVNGPERIDSAFPVVNGSGADSVIGTNFIYRNTIFECGAMGSTCTSRPVREYAPDLSDEFWADGSRIGAALGLPNRRVVLFKLSRMAIIKDGVVEQENLLHDVFHGHDHES